MNDAAKWWLVAWLAVGIFVLTAHPGSPTLFAALTLAVIGAILTTSLERKNR